MDERSVYAVITGAVIQTLRAGQMSQAALATRAELSSSALSRFENGQSLPDMYETRRLARALGRTPGQLHDVVEQALARAAQVRRKIATDDQWNTIATRGLAGLAAIAVAIFEAETPHMRQTSTLCSDYLSFTDGELTPDRAEAFRKHLGQCEGCRERVLQAIPLEALLSTLSEGDRHGKEK